MYSSYESTMKSDKERLSEMCADTDRTNGSTVPATGRNHSAYI